MEHAIHCLSDATACLDEVPILPHLGMLHEFLNCPAKILHEWGNLIQALSKTGHRQIRIAIALEELRNIPDF